jgi:hypothetical protein
MVLSNQEIIEEETQDMLVRVMADRACRAIFTATKDSPKSAKEIIKKSGIPHGTIYRRLKFLELQNLLQVTGEITDNGKRQSLYEAKICKFFFTYDVHSSHMKIFSQKNLIRNFHNILLKDHNMIDV